MDIIIDPATGLLIGEREVTLTAGQTFSRNSDRLNRSADLSVRFSAVTIPATAGKG